MNYLAIFQTWDSRPTKTVYGRRDYIKPSFRIRVIKATQDALDMAYKEKGLLPTAKIIKLPRAFFPGQEPSLKDFVFAALGNGNFIPMFKPTKETHYE